MISLRSIGRALLGMACLGLLCAGALANRHPANIPVARARVEVDGTIELKVRFDILAFALEQDPMIVLDPPMNALLDGPEAALDGELKDSKERFTHGISVVGGVMDSITFPTAADIRRQVAASPPPRLPVMAEVTVRLHLPPVVNRTSFRFPALLGTVVLTTERPYCEPITEPVEPDTVSQPLKIPTEAEVATLAATARTADSGKAPTSRLPNPSTAKAAIQAQYDRWSKAYMAHDIDALLSILSPTYSLKTAKGVTITYEEYKTMLFVRKEKHDDTTQYRTEVQRITLRDDVAAIYARETTTNPRLNPGTGKVESTSYQHDYVDAWQFKGGKWLLKSTVTLKELTLPPKSMP